MNWVTESVHDLMLIGLVAASLTLLLMLKSLRDLSQTGPRIKAEVRTHYRRYTVFALARLGLWAFVILAFLGIGGALAYRLAVVAFDMSDPVWGLPAASAAGMALGTILQFLRQLIFNPGLLVASLHYLPSRLYPVWKHLSPARIRMVQATIFAGFIILSALACARLWQQQRHDELLFYALTLLSYTAILVLASWEREPAAAPRNSASPQAPNIVMIGSDTLRADRLGALGYRRALTPNIDALARRGALFGNCYVPCARTAPSLVSLLSGMWPHNHGIRDNFVTDNETHLDVATLPQLLKPLGYRSAAVSDWCGADLGKFSFHFDTVDVPEDQWNIKYFIRQGPKDLRLFLSLFTHNPFGKRFLPELYYLGGVPLTSKVGKRARELVTQLASNGQPFLLNVFYSTTHPPFASEWPWYTRFADANYEGESKFAMAKLTDPFDIIRRQGAPREEFDLDQIVDLYDGCVAQFDDEVGKMLRHLDACGLTSRTIVVVYSDHGMELFEHDSWGQGNSAVGEASPRIPLLISDPRSAPCGVIPQVIRSIDLAPTLLDLVGATAHGEMDGTSLAACLKGKEACPQLDAFNETGIWIADIPGLPENHLRYPNLLELMEVPNPETGTLAIQSGFTQLILDAKDRMIRRGCWKLTYQPLADGHLVQLFNVETDPMCRENVAAQNPEVVQLLQEALSCWVAQSSEREA